MRLQASYSRRVFKFNFEARTSRGLMRDKVSWFIRIWDKDNPQTTGIGECGPLPGLSIDARSDFEKVLGETVERISSLRNLKSNFYDSLAEIIPPGFPSLTFGFESALLDFQNGGKRILFDTDFTAGLPIPINGLIWMGDRNFMIKNIDQKIAQGYDCLKLKVGAMNFEQECEVLDYIRTRYRDRNLTLRLDANGAFLNNAMSRLQDLVRFNIHSIEQPIPPGLAEMESLCRRSPIPIALDEELIGKETRNAKTELLKRLQPQYIILKPMLHGGLSGCMEWIEAAEDLEIGWWITSALESNIGLNAICQLASRYRVEIPQGLGTGMLYSNNIPSPLSISKGNIFMAHNQAWKLDDL